VSLGLGVERAIKVGLVGLEVSWATNWVLLIVGVDAASGEDSQVNLLQVGEISKVESTDDIASDGLLLVVLTPINIWASSAASAVQDVGWLDSLDLSKNSLAVLHADGGALDLLALGLEETLQVASDPALATPDEVRLVSSWGHFERCCDGDNEGVGSGYNGRRLVDWRRCVFCVMMEKGERGKRRKLDSCRGSYLQTRR
jgi:hypothetical protein